MSGDWKYYLCDPLTGNTYRVENGMVVSRGDYKPLPNTPIGWQDVTIGWERDMDKFGINRNFTLPLGFVIDGASIISYLKWTNNFDKRISLLIQRKTLYLDTTNYYYWYKYFYKGDLDLTTYKYDDTAQRVDVSITEGGITKLLKANQGTDYEIPLTENFVWVKMDGITLHKSVNYTVPAPSEDAPDGITVSNNSYSEFALPTATIGVDGAAAGVSLFDQQLEDVANHFTYLSTSANYLLKIDDSFLSPVEVQITGVIKIKCLVELPSGGQLQIRILKQDGTWAGDAGQPFANGLQRDPDQFGNMLTGTTYTFTINENCTLQPGDRIFFIGFLFATITGAAEIKIQFVEGTDFNVKFATRQATSYVRWKQPLPAFEYLSKQITGSDGNCTSTLLQGRGDIVITSGDAIRGIDTAVIKTNYNKFFNSYNVVLNAGTGVESDKITLEEKAHFFQTTSPIPLGQIKGYKDGDYVPLLYNTIKIGFPQVDIENVNGRYAFNTTYSYSSPPKAIAKELSLVSDYKADPYEEELLRINFDGRSTTDGTQDNDVFFAVIDLNSAEVLADGRTVYSLLRHPSWIITGMPSPETVYNFDITPRRLIDVHKNWLAGVFNGFETGVLHFETTQYNREVNANSVDEDGDISISSFGAPLFKPVQYEFQSLFSGEDQQSSQSILTAYDENSEWSHTGNVVFNDTSKPFNGTVNILGAAASLPSIINLYPPSPISLIATEELSFYIYLFGAFAFSAGLSIQFNSGATPLRLLHIINGFGFSKTNVGNYQKVSIPITNFTIVNPGEFFDSITISVFGLGRPAFAMDYIRISQSAQDNLVELLEANPNRCFSFIHPSGNLLKGHNIKIGIAPNSEQDQAFLLLATGDTDLTKLII